MKREAALTLLTCKEHGLRRQGLSALFLFGSVARDEASPASDVNLAFDVPPDAQFSLFGQARPSELAALRPTVRAHIEKWSSSDRIPA